MLPSEKAVQEFKQIFTLAPLFHSGLFVPRLGCILGHSKHPGRTSLEVSRFDQVECDKHP